MGKTSLKGRNYFGIVVDNEDPMRLGRCKIRVFQVFDKLEIEDIPWASPWNDVNGNKFQVPEIGKFVSVIFDQGNKYTPEYVYAQNYNVNLENKLERLSEDDYKSMRAVIFDQSTQIWRTKKDGLVIDHEYTNINLDVYGNIMLNLRDNKSIITLGSANVDERVVLGTTFMQWMDALVDTLLGVNGPAFIDGTGAPVIVSPSFATTLLQYKAQRKDFLSDHIKVPQNNKIVPQEREYINQVGDGVYSTTERATPGPKTQYLDVTTGKLIDYNAKPNYNPSAPENFEQSRPKDSSAAKINAQTDAMMGPTQSESQAPQEITDQLLKKWNFAEVPDGQPAGRKNYRSAQISYPYIASFLRKYNIKNIIRFNHDEGDNRDSSKDLPTNRSVEAQIAKECGVNYKSYSASDLKLQTEINKVLSQGNTWIHCAHGADRTGGGVGGYLYSLALPGLATTEEIWVYVNKYNSWNELVRDDPNEYERSYLTQAKKFGVKDMQHAKLLSEKYIAKKKG